MLFSASISNSMWQLCILIACDIKTLTFSLNNHWTIIIPHYYYNSTLFVYVVSKVLQTAYYWWLNCSQLCYCIKYQLHYNSITIYSILDQIWTNFVVNDVKSGAINTAITDHFPSFIFFNTKFKESSSLIKYRIF